METFTFGGDEWNIIGTFMVLLMFTAGFLMFGGR